MTPVVTPPAVAQATVAKNCGAGTLACSAETHLGVPTSHKPRRNPFAPSVPPAACFSPETLPSTLARS